MKLRYILFLILSLAALAFSVPGFSQQASTLAPQPVPPGYAAPQGYGVAQYVPAPASQQGANVLLGGVSQQQSGSEIAQLVKQLGEAEDSAKKSDITKQLESAVAKAFDGDLEERETDLSKLEDRVKKLRSQLDRRRRAKDDIIQLQLKVLVNEADGLGFTTQSRQPGTARWTYDANQNLYQKALNQLEPASPSATPRPATKAAPAKGR